MGTSTQSLDILIEEHETLIWALGLEEKKRFVDIAPDGTGKICKMYYYPRTKQYKL